MEPLKGFNAENWDSDVLKSEKPVLVEFYATWCEPCERQTQILQELLEEGVANIVIGWIDYDRHEELANRYQVFGIPSLLLFEHGKVKEFFEGVTGMQALRHALVEPSHTSS